MNLELERPIVFFDLETTGTDISKDRIVEIYAKKIHPNGAEEELYHRINPNMPIPVGASRVHGLTNEILAFEPYCEDVAEEIADFFTNSDIGGYNIIRFDIPILVEEFVRTNLNNPIENANLVDSMSIFHKMVPRSLAGALKYYKDKDIENAHTAKADVLATIEVFTEQLNKHNEIPKTTGDIEEFILNGRKIIDYAGYLMRDKSGDIVFTFGKHKYAKAVENKDYLNWMLNSDFPLQTKRVIQQLLDNKI